MESNQSERFMVSSRLVKSLLYFAEAEGLDPTALIQDVEIDPAVLEDEYGRIAIAKEQRLWRLVAQRLHRVVHGQEVIAIIPYGYLGLPELLFATAPTVRDALLVVVDFIPLIRDGLSVRLVHRRDGWLLSYCFGEPMSVLESNAMASFASGLNALIMKYTGVDLGTLEAKEPPSDSDVAHGNRVSPADVDRYGAGTFFLMVPSRKLTQPLQTAAPQLHLILRAHASEILERMNDDSVFFSKIRHAMTLELREGHMTLKGVAARLQVSERTLQRKIAYYGSTFGDLRTSVRQELAQQYLNDALMTISEVSWRLGYGSSQAFHRAFHRWFGESPTVWRKRMSHTSLTNVESSEKCPQSPK